MHNYIPNLVSAYQAATNGLQMKEFSRQISNASAAGTAQQEAAPRPAAAGALGAPWWLIAAAAVVVTAQAERASANQSGGPDGRE